MADRGRAGITEAALERLQDDVRRERAHTRATAELPVDIDQARRELSEEQRAHRASRPKNRRWRALDRLDKEIDQLTQRHADAVVRLTEAGAALTAAPAVDAESLAAWLSGGERGARPESSVYELERARDAASLLVEAVAVELDLALERRVQHIEKHRKSMLRDARDDLDASRKRLLDKVAELAPIREELVAARSTLTWLASYPEPAEEYGFVNAVALGLAEPVQRTLNTNARLEFTNVVAALEEDAAALAGRFSRTQRQQLGDPVPAIPPSQATWDTDPETVAGKRAELERARRLAEFHPNPAEIADGA